MYWTLRFLLGALAILGGYFFFMWRKSGLTPRYFQITEIHTLLRGKSQATIQRNLISASSTHDLFLRVTTQSLYPLMSQTKAVFITIVQCRGCITAVFQTTVGYKIVWKITFLHDLQLEWFFYKGWLRVAHQLWQRHGLTAHVIETIDCNFINTNVHKAQNR